MLSNKKVKSMTAQLQQILDMSMKVGDRAKIESEESDYIMEVRCFSDAVIIVEVHKGEKHVATLLIDKENRKFLQKAVRKKTEADNNAIFSSLSREMKQGKFQEIDFGRDETEEEPADDVMEAQAYPRTVGEAVKKGISSVLSGVAAAL